MSISPGLEQFSTRKASTSTSEMFMDAKLIRPTRTHRMTQIAIMTALLLAAPTASARIIAGFEFCNTGSCNGWVFGEDGDENSHNVYFSPTGGNSCNNNTVNFGFAVVGNNNMCNSSAACEQCSVTAPKNTGAACDHYPETCFIHGRTPVLP